MFVLRRIQDMTGHLFVCFIFFISINSVVYCTNKEGYYGKFLGKLSQFHHGVSGEVYAVDARTLHLKNFNYDGEGPAAYFYVGSSKAPNGNGLRIRDERGTTNVLPRYRNKHITLTLPEGKTLQNIRWFSVWCDEFAVNFGDVRIPKGFDFPRPQKLGSLSGIHSVSSEPVVIVDAQTLLIPSFTYDGEAPDAKFWAGRGPKPSPQGIRIPDENGKEVPLRRYDRKTIVLTLPNDLTVFDIGHFGVWCEAFTVDFGHVQIPRNINIPPSLKMLGVSPQKRSRSLNIQQPVIQQQNVNNPLFYQDFSKSNNIPNNLQNIKPTTYKPQLARNVPFTNNINTNRYSNFEIQKSISLPHNQEFVINEHTGEFERPNLEIQHSRRQEYRVQPTPAEKIVQHNPTEPTLNQEIYRDDFVYNQQGFQQPIFVPPPPPTPVQQQPQQTVIVPQQTFVQQPFQPNFQQPDFVTNSPTTNHFGTIFNQQNVETSVNHAPEFGAGSFSRFVFNRATGHGTFHRYQ